MERWPFGGAVIYTLARDLAGGAFDARPDFSINHWDAASQAAALADFRSARSAKLAGNFPSFGANPGPRHWFDDADWKEAVGHCHLLARLARQGGLKSRSLMLHLTRRLSSGSDIVRNHNRHGTASLVNPTKLAGANTELCGP